MEFYSGDIIIPLTLILTACGIVYLSIINYISRKADKEKQEKGKNNEDN